MAAASRLRPISPRRLELLSQRPVAQILIARIREDLADPEVIAEVERRVRAAVRQQHPKADHGKRIAELRGEVANLTDAIAGGLLKSSPALAQRLQATEAELARLEAEARRAAAPIQAVVPNVRKHWLALLDRLHGVLEKDPERGREDLREVLEERVRLRPDESGRFLWADYALGLAALVPNAEIMVAGAGFEPATFGL